MILGIVLAIFGISAMTAAYFIINKIPGGNLFLEDEQEEIDSDKS